MCLLAVEKCEGQSVESSVCRSAQCPSEESWTPWSSWTACSVTCGRGTTSRRRSCTVPSVSSSVLLRDAKPRGLYPVPALFQTSSTLSSGALVFVCGQLKFPDLQAETVPDLARRVAPAELLTV